MNLEQIIIGFDLWYLELPVVSVRNHAIGKVGGSCEVIVLRLTSEGGVEGFGEASPWVVFTGSPEASFAALDRYFRPLVLGRPVSDRAKIVADAARAVAHCTEAKAALETALLDLEGRILGKPVYDLLGGKARDAIPLSVSIADPYWLRDEALLARLREDGVGIIKLKTGFAGHAFDMMRLERIAADWPDFAVRLITIRALVRPTPLNRSPRLPAWVPTSLSSLSAPRNSPQWRTFARALTSPSSLMKASSAPKI